MTTFAGQTGIPGFADGTGTAASLFFPDGVITDNTNLYVVDTFNDTIRQIVIAARAVTTLAGQTGVAGSADGVGTAALFNTPVGITANGTNIYATDTVNDTIRNVVR